MGMNLNYFVVILQNTKPSLITQIVKAQNANVLLISMAKISASSVLSAEIGIKIKKLIPIVSIYTV